MIRNDEELEVVRQQLGRAEAALLSLRKRMLPRNSAKFDLVSEGYLEMIVRLRSEVDAYLGLESAYAQQPYLVLVLEGERISRGKARVSFVSQMLERFRRALKAVSKPIEGSYDLLASSRERLLHAFDPPLLGVVSGSLRILFADAGSGDTPDGETASYHRAVELLLVGVEMIDNSQSKDGNDRPSDEMCRTIYRALLKISPTPEGDLELLRFGGRAVGNRQLIPLSKESTHWLRDEVKRLDKALAGQRRAARSFEGVIRRINLDARTFVLRQNVGSPRWLTFSFDENQEGPITLLLRQCVAVTGIEMPRGAGKLTFKLIHYKPLNCP